MHDGHDREGGRRALAAQALPVILGGLKERGLASVSVSELIGVPGSGAARRDAPRVRPLPSVATRDAADAPN